MNTTEVFKRVNEMGEAGHSANKISRTLNSEGYRTIRGNKYTAKYISNVQWRLRNNRIDLTRKGFSIGKTTRMGQQQIEFPLPPQPTLTSTRDGAEEVVQLIIDMPTDTANKTKILRALFSK